ncbi:MAG: PIG-L family deacetylase [Bryobacterales bacterium]|nr:PIG-L family deacetylase [Bryobacterales bacterium]
MNYARFVRTLVFLVLIGHCLHAREPIPEDRGAAGLWQSLKRINNNARAMHITAHPDDEDGGTITLLSRGMGVEMTLLCLNRGESGANLVTGDFFDGLGALRTVELLKAAEYYGAKVRFTRFIDYGFSKNVNETFRNWNRDEVLRDVVRIIRTEKPHVLISRWQGMPRDGHGNHEAAGVMAQLAFDAAGDPKRFPEQIAQGLAAWQPQKLYSDNRREGDDWTVRVDSGVYDPVIGRSYAQIARDGLRNQRSQGAGSSISRPGPSVSYYKLLASRVGEAAKEKDFFERVTMESHPEVARHAAAARQAFSASAPALSVPHLEAGLAAARADGLNAKERQFTAALQQALGISLEALVEPENPPTGPFADFRGYEIFGVATPGQTFRVKAALHEQGARKVTLRKIELSAPKGWTVKPLPDHRFEVTVPMDAAPTRAYWKRGSVQETSYEIVAPELFSMPLPPAPVVAKATYLIGATEAAVESAAETSFIDSIGVQHRRTLVAGPPVSLRTGAEWGMLPLGRTESTLTVTVRNHVNGSSEGSIRLEAPQGWRTDPVSLPYSFSKENEESILSFKAIAPTLPDTRAFPLRAVATWKGREYRESFEAYTQPGLETVYLSQPAVQQIRAIDVKVVPGLRAGYVMGTGDEVPEGLRQLGIPVDMLDSAALATGDLSKYSTILLGIRAYAARQDVKTYNPRLLDYVKRGGVLVVQYNTQEYDKNFGPYPYSMTRSAEEISEEDAPVEMLDPNDPVFQSPNRITSKDFDGWVEQRGSKFMTTWDPRFKALLASNDTGQKPQRGGWLVARHGEGLYVYCAYAWYRQLPYAVPGATRIFANLVSLGAKDASWRK